MTLNPSAGDVSPSGARPCLRHKANEEDGRRQADGDGGDTCGERVAAGHGSQFLGRASRLRPTM